MYEAGSTILNSIPLNFDEVKPSWPWLVLPLVGTPVLACYYVVTGGCLVVLFFLLRLLLDAWVSADTNKQRRDGWLVTALSCCFMIVCGLEGLLGFVQTKAWTTPGFIHFVDQHNNQTEAFVCLAYAAHCHVELLLGIVFFPEVSATNIGG
eukprot:GHVT01077422.1.p2 GENE.GHVT01077422.1~~GHVT01077422.1.p2  ORF type:complete len:151 (+),score=10.05 GHVT01077422.1:139-591(+)